MSWNMVKLAFSLFFIIGTNIGLAQQPNLDFSTIPALENLSNSKSKVLAQDSTGYLWIGSEQGLFRFDGQTVYAYQNDDNNKRYIPSGRINQLLVDSKNTLWVCSNDGIFKYNPQFDDFSPVVIDGNQRGLPGYILEVIAEDSDGQIYTAYGKGVFKYNRQKNQFSKITEINQGKIESITFDNENNIWIAGTLNGGLNFYDQKKRQLTTFMHDPANNQSISMNEIADIAIVKDHLWIATLGGGIDSYQLKNRTFRHYFVPAYFENFARNIFIDKKQNIWISTLGSLKLFSPSNDNFYNYYYDANKPKSISKGIVGFYEDRHGNYWAIHAAGGVRVVKSKNKFQQYTTSPESCWHTSEKNISSIAGDASGNLYFGNYYNGIDVFKFKENKVDRYFHKNNDPNSLGNGTIAAIFCDSKKQIWIGSNFGGLQRLIPENNTFESYLNRPEDTLSIATNDVRSITEADNGDLWIAVQGKGVDRFDVKNKTFHHYNNQNNHLSNDYSSKVYYDSKGNLWVATSWGLNLLRKGEAIFRNFILVKDDSMSVSDNQINTIYEDQQHRIWVGTAEGLDNFNPEIQNFTRYSAGLKNKQVTAILSDQEKNIWISTKKGISKFNILTHQFSNFDQSDGLLSKEFLNSSCLKSETNELYFGGSEGIDFFNPDSLDKETNLSNVVLTGFKLFNKTLSYDNDSSIIHKHISYARNIDLNYQNNSFTFLYQVINLTKSDKITYSYRLEGVDKDWFLAGTKNEANYSNLSPGKYIFRVKARYDNGKWSEKETSVEINIVPAWWMTIWFKMILGLLLFITPFIIVFLRIKQLRNQSEKLELLVKERTNEIQNKNDQLKALNSTKDKLFSVISHDLRSPFNAILGFEEILVCNYDELSDKERKNMIGQLQSTTKQVYSLVENLLNWASIQTNSIRYQPVEFNLNELILEKLNLYQEIAKSKGITLNYELQEKLIAFADMNLLETSLRNLINNAIKFTTTCGIILIKASQQNNVICLSVIDSGTGMTQDQINSLFNLEKTQTKRGTKGEKGSGLGLLLCKEFIEKNKGTLTVESQPGKGSTFSFTVPGHISRALPIR
jgi:signal transduction histidine kinase/ligand-binding sensor domain-containing protein